MEILKFENYITIRLKFLAFCNETQVGDKMFIVGEKEDMGEKIELFTYPSFYPQWESQVLLLNLKKGQLLQFSVYILKSDYKAIYEKLGSREIEVSKLSNNKTYICSFVFNTSDKFCVDELKSSFENELFEFNCSRRCHAEDTNNFLDVVKSSSSGLNELKQVISKSKNFKDKIPTKCPTFDKDEILLEVSRIVLFRLTVLLSNESKYKSAIVQSSYLNVMGVYREIYYNYSNNEIVKFLLCLILHSSQAFVNTEQSSLLKVNEILQNNLFRVSPTGICSLNLLLKRDNAFVITDALNILGKIYNSEKFKVGVRKFIVKHYEKVKNVEEEVSLATKFFESNIDKIKFVKDGYFYGMCGVEGEIYISEQGILKKVLDVDSSLISVKNFRKAQVFLISAIVHENAHSLLREVLLKNWLKLPSKPKIEIEDVDPGFNFEEMVFGVCIGDFNSALSILDIANWCFNMNNRQQQPLLNAKDIEQQRESTEYQFKKLNGFYCPSLEGF